MDMRQSLTPETRIVASRHQLSTTLSGETVILQMQDGTYYGLDAVGTRIWALITQPTALNDIAATVEQEYDVDGARALADLRTLVGELLARGLVEIAAA
jgi:hypothetical protein